MPMRRVGLQFEQFGCAFRAATRKQELSGLEFSSEKGESTYLAAPAGLDISGLVVQLPEGLVLNLDKIYVKDPITDTWQATRDYTQINDKVTLKTDTNCFAIALPWQTFSETVYEDGETVYEMYLTRTDSRIYRNIILTCSDMAYDPFVDLSFSLSADGPWSPQLTSYRLINTFYVKVRTLNMSSLSKELFIPTKTLGLECLVCE